MKNIKQYTTAENFQIMKEKYSFRKKKLFETDVNNSFVTIARTTTSCLRKKIESQPTNLQQWVLT